MKKSYALLILLALVAALAAGCGGSGSSAAKLDSSDVAVVGDTHISQAQFDRLMASGKQSYKQQGQTFPKQGTAGYETVKGQAVTYLVQRAELNAKAASLGVTVSAKQIDTRLTALIKQYYGGSHAKYEKAVKAQGVTDADVRDNVHDQLLDQALFNKVTKGVKVSDKQIDNYFVSNPAQFPAAATSRKVRHILVKQKTLANSIYKQLKSGTDKTWCTLAKKYSQDPSSKDKCGVLTVTKGETVPVFDKVAFTQKTGVVHAPVYDSAQYKSYFVIEPLTDIKPGTKTPDAADKTKIAATLSSTSKNTYMNNWVKNLEKGYCTGSKIRYATGYTPSPDPCDSLTSSSTTTSSTTTG
jgi:foldase protein PrsA